MRKAQVRRRSRSLRGLPISRTVVAYLSETDKTLLPKPAIEDAALGYALMM